MKKGEKILYAVVRVRGGVDAKKEIKDTLAMLKLKRVNHCAIVPKTSVFEGMIRKVRDYVTWGEIRKDVLERLVKERGENKEKGSIILFRLSPPKKGYKNIKYVFPKGALGYRGEKINELIERMI
jgi:large subunit ribosomal protein L30